MRLGPIYISPSTRPLKKEDNYYLQTGQMKVRIVKGSITEFFLTT